MRVAHTRRLGIILLPAALILLALTASYFAAPSPPLVREEAMRAEISQDAVTITVPITQRSGSFKGTLTLELLNTSGDKTAGASMPLETTGLVVEALASSTGAGSPLPPTKSAEPDVLERAARRGPAVLDQEQGSIRRLVFDASNG